MCDYSLEAYRSRPAREGEKYVTTRFTSGSIGFTSPGDCSTAVCIQRDTQLRLEKLPEGLQQRYGVGPAEDATFVHLDRGPYHDGVRFKNGAEITLQDLRPGVTAIVTMSLQRQAEQFRVTVPTY